MYPELFAVIGTTWGSTGTDSFNLPDARDCMLVGATEDNPLGTENNGEDQNDRTIALRQMPLHHHEKGTLEVEDSDPHSHNYKTGGSRNLGGGQSSGQGGNSGYGFGGSTGTSSDGAHEHNINGQSGFEGESESFDIREPTMYVKYGVRVS